MHLPVLTQIEIVLHGNCFGASLTTYVSVFQQKIGHQRELTLKDNYLLFGQLRQQSDIMCRWRESLNGQSPWGTWVGTEVGWN
jgi:hypothetical protein